MTLVKTQDLPSDRRYVFGYHPHGIIGVGAIGSFATEGEYARRVYRLDSPPSHYSAATNALR